ncbi:MAG: tetratricopeptide repeat protein [Candidatus Hydrogenedentota bacterium]
MRHFYAFFLLIVLTIIVFGQTASFDFVEIDDQVYLLENPQFNGGLTLENIKWSFTTGYFLNWHPVTWLSYFLDNTVYGMDARGYHISNLIIHLLASLLLYWALFKMTACSAESLIVAVLFACHPQHVQSVAWVAERKDVLSGFFMALTLLLYHRYTVTKKLSAYLLVLLVYALGLMSKPMLVTLPFVLLLLDFWPLGRLAERSEIRRAVLEKLPMLAMAIASSIITFVLQRGGGATLTVEAFGFDERVAIAIQAYGAYLWRTVFPFGFTFFYPLPQEINYLWVSITLAILVIISVVAWRTRKIHPYVLVGWLWYLGTLFPVSGLVQTGQQASADRYTYIPLIGIFIALAFYIHPRIEALPKGRKVMRFGYPAIAIILVVLATLETSYWKNTETLAARGIVVREDNYQAYRQLGNVYRKEGNAPQAERMYRSYFEYEPDSRDVHIDLATVLQNQKKFSEAETVLDACIEKHPEFARAYYNMGVLKGVQGDFATAQKWYVEAIAFPNPRPNYYINYGNVLARLGQLESALEQYDAAIELNPLDHVAHHSRAGALFGLQRTEEAFAAVQQSIALDGSYEPARSLRAAIQAKLKAGQ